MRPVILRLVTSRMATLCPGLRRSDRSSSRIVTRTFCVIPFIWDAIRGWDLGHSRDVGVPCN